MTYDDTDGRRGCYRHHPHHHHHGAWHCGPRGAVRGIRSAIRRRTRLTRDADQGIIAGVCAGIARHLGLRPKVVRIAAVISLIIFTVPTAIAYLLIAWLAPNRDDSEEMTAAAAQEATAEAVHPGGSVEGLARLKNRFRRLEEKLADIEAQVLNDGTA